MKTLILMTTILIAFVNCGDEGNTQANKSLFNATVINNSTFCGSRFLIRFNDDVEGLPENNVGEVPIFLETGEGKVSHPNNLPSEYKVVNMQVNVTFRKLNDTEDLYACDLSAAFSLFYPSIYIVNIIR